MDADIASVVSLAGLICIPLPIYAKVNMDADINIQDIVTLVNIILEN